MTRTDAPSAVTARGPTARPEARYHPRVLDYRAVCSSHAAAAIAGGLALVTAPCLLLGLFGLPTDAGVLALARLAGGMMFGLGMTLWSVRDTPQARVVYGNGAVDIVMTMVFFEATRAGAVNDCGHLLTALFAVNALTWFAARRDLPR